MADKNILTFDLMQNVPVPTLTHGSMFYSRQLWVYNFGIHNATTVVDQQGFTGVASRSNAKLEIVFLLIEIFSLL